MSSSGVAPVNYARREIKMKNGELPTSQLRGHDGNLQSSSQPIGSADGVPGFQLTTDSDGKGFDRKNGTTTYRESDDVTLGVFADQAEAEHEFDSWILRTGWQLHTEVEGKYVQPKAFWNGKQPRIDKIVIPPREYGLGAIGIELKPSGIKMGPALSQAMDYMRAAFEIKPSKIQVMLSSCFLFPAEIPGGTGLSLISQHRVGGCFIDWHFYDKLRMLVFQMANLRMLVIREDGDVKVDSRAMSVGRKIGSR